MPKLAIINQSTIFNARSMEFCGDVRISDDEKFYFFEFTNHLLPYEYKVSRQELLDYTESVVDGVIYATCQDKLISFVEREVSWDEKPSYAYIFCRFANDILEDYWDVIEANLISGEYLPETVHLKRAA